MFDLTALALNLPAYLLVLCRATGILIAAPILSSSSLPYRIRIALAVLLALLMYPFAVKYGGALPATMLGYVPLILTEAGLGLLMGFSAGLILAALRAAGGLAAQQIGLTLDEIVSPEQEDEPSDQVSMLFEIVALLVFLAIDGHHWFIQALAASYRDVPLGEVTVRPALAGMVTHQTSSMFVLALRGAAPLMGIMFLVNMVVALMSKAVPQMNILMVGYPVKIFIGMISMALTFPLMWPVMRDAFHTLHAQLLTIARAL